MWDQKWLHYLLLEQPAEMDFEAGTYKRFFFWGGQVRIASGISRNKFVHQCCQRLFEMNYLQEFSLFRLSLLIFYLFIALRDIHYSLYNLTFSSYYSQRKEKHWIDWTMLMWKYLTRVVSCCWIFYFGSERNIPTLIMWTDMKCCAEPLGSPRLNPPEFPLTLHVTVWVTFEWNVSITTGRICVLLTLNVNVESKHDYRSNIVKMNDVPHSYVIVMPPVEHLNEWLINDKICQRILNKEISTWNWYSIVYFLCTTLISLLF